jgi:hypothetical protein
MIPICGRRRIVAVRAAALVAGLTGGLLAGPAVMAARVDGLYAASVPIADGSPDATQAAYAEALRRVLIKVTGRRAAAADATLLSQFGDPAAMVQQYRHDRGSLWAQFDALAVRAVLDRTGQPVWGDERPTTIVWLAFDAGGGDRDILSGGEAAAGGAAVPDAAAGLRRELLQSADDRGVPLVLPLRDSQDLAAVAYADVWGEFSDRVLAASQRYQADAVLVGRARLFPAGMPDVRWTLHLGTERFEWRGGVADGPAGLAERLAARLATTGASDSELLLTVSGIGSFDQYGQVSGYLRGLDMIEAVSVAYVMGDAVGYALRIRGDREQLVRTLALRRVLQPETAAPDMASPLGGPPADLRYRLAGGA